MIKDRKFLKKAREQLDADHFGLDKVKRRLIEYLAVVRLKQLAAESEQAKDAELIEEAETLSEAVVHRSDQTPIPVPVALSKPKSRNSVKGPILLYVQFR